MLRGGRRSWQALQRSVPPPPPLNLCPVWLRQRVVARGWRGGQGVGTAASKPAAAAAVRQGLALGASHQSSFSDCGGPLSCSFPVPCLFHLESADSAHPPPVAAHVGGSLWQGARAAEEERALALGHVLWQGRVARNRADVGVLRFVLCEGSWARTPPNPPPPWGPTLKDGVEAVTTPPRFPGRTPVGRGGRPDGSTGRGVERTSHGGDEAAASWAPPAAAATCARRGWAERVAAGGSTEGGAQRRTLWTLPFSYFFHPKVTTALPGIAAVADTRTKRDRPLLYATVFS